MGLNKLVEELSNYRDDIDATQIAEILWLQETIGFKKEHQAVEINHEISEEKVQEEKTQKTPQLPRDVTHQVLISSPKKKSETSSRHTLEKSKNSNTFYGVKLRDKEKFPDIIKQFQLLKLKQQRLVPPKLTNPKFIELKA